MTSDDSVSTATAPPSDEETKMILTCLAQACMKGDVHIVKDLLQKDHGAIAPVLEQTPLEWNDRDGKLMVKPAIFIAVDYGHKELVQVLLSAVENVDRIRDDNDYTPLQWASWTGNKEIVQVLIDAGVTVDGEALSMAREEGHDHVAQLLLDHIDLYAGLENEDEIMEKACREGDCDRVRSILDQGYDLSKWRDEEGGFHQFSPMYMAVKFGHMDIVQMFMQDKDGIKMDDNREKEGEDPATASESS